MLRKIFNKSIFRLPMMGLVGVFLFSQLFIAYAPVVKAQLEEPIHPIDQSRIWNASWHIYGCLWDPDDRHDIHRTRSETDLQSGSIFYNVQGTSYAFDPLNVASGAAVTHPAGPILSTGGHYLSCRTNDIAKSFDALGITPKDAFYGNGSAGIYGVNGDRFARNEDLNDHQRAESFISYIGRTYPNLNIPNRSNNVPSQNPAAEYFQFYKIYERSCRGIEAGSGGSGATVKVVNENTGEITDEVYSIKSGDVDVPYGRMSCQQIVERVNTRSDAGSRGVKAWIDAGGTTFSDTEAGEVPPSCESQSGENSWIICPILRMADAAISGLDDVINNLLTTPDAYTSSEGLRAAWSNLRNLAYIILVPIVLVMVISTALGFEFVSAYTIKRAFPRLVAATIFIALSFDITQFLVTLTNSIGTGIGGLIMSSFGNGGNITLADVFNASGENDVGLVFGSIAGGFAVLALGSIGILGSYLLVGLIAMTVGFLLLAFRQMLVIALMILAPIAILAWIFPGNDKMWKLWWGTFSKLLLLFPLVTLLVAVGRSFALLVSTVDGSTGSAGAGDFPLINTLIKLIAYVGPYFLIPAMFKFAGGAFATIAGMANDRERGLFDRQRKYRGQKMADTWKSTLGGNRFKGGNSSNLRGRLNRGLQGGALIGTGGAGLNPLKMRRELNRSVSSAARVEQQELMQNNEDVKTAMVDDDIARAVLHGGNEQQMRAMLQGTGRFTSPGELDDAVSLAQRAQQAGSGRAVKSAMAVGLAGSKTGYDTHSEMFEAIVAAADGDTALERALLADAKKASEGARPDLAAPGYTTSWNALQRVKGAMGTSTVGSTRAGVNADMRREALRQTGAHAMLAGKSTQTVQREMTQLGSDYRAAMAAGDVEQATELASQIAAYRGAMGSASPEARSHVMSMLEAVGIDPGAVNPDTGAAYSVDEQLGSQLAELAVTNFGGSPIAPTPGDLERIRQEATQNIRSRAGLYDAGGGDRTPEQLRGMRPPDET